MASSCSSSSSSFHVPGTKYDVFISFRGEDTRSSFLSHLVKELRQHQIVVYVDDRLHPGDEISSTLLQAIQESFISLVIFSKHYASSKWCMEELVKIIECMEQDQRIVIPVFHNVDPCDVRHQKRTFEEAFDKHQGTFKENLEKVQCWRSAIKKAANLSGFHYPSKYQNESELIEEIVKDVLEKLSHIFPSVSNGLVGIDGNIKCIESLLAIESSEVRIIGIWGMGGIGKTTIAEAIFEKYSPQYEGSCFLENVREESEKHELSYLFHKLVSELLQGENLFLKGPAKARSNNVKRRLGRKKVFIVLDDVNALHQLEHLIGEKICLGPGSRVIVTTRDKQILIRVHRIYEVQKLNFKNSLKLFCLNAFNKIYPEIGYEKLSETVVDYANGIPLALKVLGSFLYSRSTEVWKSELRKLKIYPDMQIYNVLKLSYDGIDDSERSIFLDIAFFFKGKDKEIVIRFLDSCGFCADVGIDNLLRKTLITISNDNRIKMHDLIEQMGWEIVRQESIKDPGKRSRLRNPEDVYNVLKNNRGTELVEGIMLNLSQTEDLYLSVDSFKKMPNLRFLKIHKPRRRRSSSVYIPTALESFPDELRYLKWSEYPLKSLPSTFCAEKLVELRMPRSQISKLWDGAQDLVNLREIYLRGCKELVELPDFTKASNLKKIDLAFCESLCHVHPSILSIHALEELNLHHCKDLKSLKGKIHLKSLAYLEVNGCSSLQEFSISSEEIRWLDLNQTRIDMLHSSIGCLTKLQKFYLGDLRLKSLPNELCFLTSLEELWLPGCEQLIELPRNIIALSRLKVLHLRNCRGLRSLPELPPSIIGLDATNCMSLETVFGTKAGSNLNKMYISFENCTRLDEHSLYDIMEDAYLTMMQAAIGNLLRRTHLSNEWRVSEFYRGEVRYPGSKVPKWFRYQTRQASIIVEIDQPPQLLGFFVCCVISQVPSSKRFHHIECQCYFGDGKKDKYKSRRRYTTVYGGLNSDHVYVRYDPSHYGRILKDIKKCRVNDHFTTYDQKVSFKFITKPWRYDGFEVEAGFENKPKVKENFNLAGTPEHDCFVKGCGIYPIYVSDVQNYTQKMELDFDDESKRYHELVLSSLENLTSLKMKRNQSSIARNFILRPLPIATTCKKDE